MRILKKILFIFLFFVMFFGDSSVIKADTPHCYLNVFSENKNKFDAGDTFVLEYGIEKGVGVVYGAQYNFYYSKSDLEIIDQDSSGVGAYNDWNVNLFEVNDYGKIVIDVGTDDKEKFHYASDGLKFGYIKFKIKEGASNFIFIKMGGDSFVKRYEFENYEPDFTYDIVYTDDNFICNYSDVVVLELNKNELISDIKINDISIENFDYKKNDYYIKTNDEKIKIDVVAKNDVEITGDIGEFELKNKINLFRFTAKKSNGENVVYYLTVDNSDRESNVNTLDSLSLSNVEFEFDKNKFEYDIEVPNQISKVTISSVLSDKNASYVEGFGDRDVNLNVGKNEVLIKVKAENGNLETYKLNIFREGADCNIKNIIIENYVFLFDLTKTEYYLFVDKDEKKLNINIELYNQESEYVIKGNEKLKNGSVIVITVTDKNNNEKDYIINIRKDNKKNGFLKIDKLNFIGLMIVVGFLIIAVMELVLRKKMPSIIKKIKNKK